MTKKGTWDMPVLLIHDPSGFAFYDDTYPDLQYWLLEGHTRHDCLLGLASYGMATKDHEVLAAVLTPRLPSGRGGDVVGDVSAAA